MPKEFGPNVIACVVAIGFLGAATAAKALAQSDSRAEAIQSVSESTRDLVRRAAELEKQSAALLARIEADAERRRLEHEQQPYSVSSKNFVVGAMGKSFAEAVLAKAESLRKTIGLECLGYELPDGQEFTLIQVELSDEEDEGLTLLCGPGRRFRGDHRMVDDDKRRRQGISRNVGQPGEGRVVAEGVASGC